MVYVVELHQDGHVYTRAGRRERDDSSPIQRAEEECSQRVDGIV